MKLKLKALLSCLVVIATLVVSQIAFLAPASAAEGEYADMFVYVGSSRTEVHQEGFFDYSWVQICNNGNASIKNFTFDSQETNWTLDTLTVAQPDQWNTATDLGSISGNVWTGQMDPTQCLTLFQWGHVTGNNGDEAGHTFSITASTLYDDTVNVDPNSADDTASLTLPITAPQYEVNLTPYIGDSGHTYETVWDGFVPQYQWINVCSSGSGTLKSFQLDVTTQNWSGVSFGVDTNSWSNSGVLDAGSITSDGLWTGQLQPDKCINFRMYGTVSGSIGDDAVITAVVSNGIFLDDTVNVDTYPGDDTRDLIQPIQEPVYSLELSTYLGNNNAEFPVHGRFQNTWMHICSSGYGSIESMSFNFETQNWTMESIQVDSYAAPDNNNATDLGSISTNGVWHGRLDAGQCIVFHADGPITGNLGDIVSWTATMTSSTLTGGEPNIDSFSGNDSMTISAPVAETGDLAIQTRLMTSGSITDGSSVSYEVEIQNVGAGVIHDSDIGLYYILPVGASLIGITDLNTEDALSPVGCASMGPVNEIAPAFQNYSGEVIQCLLHGPQAGIVPGSSYPFQLDLEATQGFTSGNTEVYGVVLSGNIQEPDSATFVMEFSSGRDGFRLNINNIMHLTYDANELQVTINRCEGYSEEVVNDDACFTVEFSKPVWAASFDITDLVLEGGGHVTSFEMVNNTKWTVHISGMTPGGTLRLMLGVASVSDYSAVANGTSVLGENIIRFAAPETASEDNAGTSATVLDPSSSGSVEKGTASTASANTGSSLSELTQSLITLGTASGLVSEIPDTFAAKLDSAVLLLGSLSIMKNYVLDFAFIIINFAGLTALILILKNRRRVSA